MKLVEVSKLLSILAAAYPTWKAAADKDTLTLWHEMLADMPDALVLAAAKRLIATSPYPPSIADVRKNAVEVVDDGNGKMAGDEAWQIILRAIQRYGPYQFNAARATIPDDVWDVAKSFSWRELCGMEDSQISVIRAQFIRIYDARNQRRKTDMQVPTTVHEMAAQLADSFSMAKLLGESEETR